MVSRTGQENAPKNKGKAFGSATNILLALIGLLISAGPAVSENTRDWITGSGPLVLIPYPAVTVDMGQYLERLKQPRDIEQLWIDYVTGLAREAEAHPDRDATIVVIGIHPFVVGTPDGAEALRHVLENFKKQKLVWVTDVQAVLDVAGEKQ